MLTGSGLVVPPTLPARPTPPAHLTAPSSLPLTESKPNNALTQTIGELPAHDFQVQAKTPGRVVTETLTQHPDLPGVIICDDRTYLGMIACQKILENLSRPYGLEVYLGRPIQLLLSTLNFHQAPIPAETRIEVAVQIALSRPPHSLYDPLVVEYADADHSLRLVDFYDLLMAQSRWMEQINHFIRQQHEIGQLLTKTLDLDQVLNLILEHLADIVPYDRAGIMLPREKMLQFVATRGFPLELALTDMQIALAEGTVYHQIYASQQPVAIPDVSLRSDWRNIEPLPFARSWLGVPLIHSETVIGMLSLVRISYTPYQDGEIELARAFASQAALALKNASLYAEVQALNRDLENKVQERTQALQLAYERLEQLDQAKSKFIAIVSHELRTPLTVIKGYAQMLRHDPYFPPDSAPHQKVVGIETGLLRLQELVNSMIEIARIDNQTLELHLEPVAVSVLAQTELQAISKTLHERELTFEVNFADSLPLIQADPQELGKVFRHLLLNAIKYTPDRGHITLAGHSQGEDYIEITVADTGIGIDPEFQELIFTKFYQTGEVALHSSGKTKFKGGGAGLGLTIVRGIVEAHQGNVWVESPGYDDQKYPGSVFHILLPLRPQRELVSGSPLSRRT